MSEDIARAGDAMLRRLMGRAGRPGMTDVAAIRDAASLAPAGLGLGRSPLAQRLAMRRGGEGGLAVVSGELVHPSSRVSAPARASAQAEGGEAAPAMAAADLLAPLARATAAPTQRPGVLAQGARSAAAAVSGGQHPTRANRRPPPRPRPPPPPPPGRRAPPRRVWPSRHRPMSPPLPLRARRRPS